MLRSLLSIYLQNRKTPIAYCQRKSGTQLSVCHLCNHIAGVPKARFKCALYALKSSGAVLPLGEAVALAELSVLACIE
jgi:hypothetical protein